VNAAYPFVVSLPPGSYHLILDARSSHTQALTQQAIVLVHVAPADPHMALDGPAPGTSPSSHLRAGISAIRSAGGISSRACVFALSSKSGTVTRASRRPIARSMSRRLPSSSGAAIVHASPVASARPVRPTRWSESSDTRGTSKLTRARAPLRRSRARRCRSRRAGQPGIFLGLAAYGAARPDVAAAYGAAFGASGFSLSVSGLAPGTYDLVAWPFSTVTGTFNQSQGVIVTIPSEPAVAALRSPLAGSTLSSDLYVSWTAGFSTGGSACLRRCAPGILCTGCAIGP
jgi:hypothetical protein